MIIKKIIYREVKMARTIIDEEVYKRAKEALSKMKNKGTTANKLKAVISSYSNGIKKVSEVFGVHVTSIHRWARQIKNNEMEALVNKSKHQDGILIKKKHKAAIAEWLSKNPSLTIKEVMSLVEKEFNISASRSTIHRAMRSSGFSYITPRQQHYKQDKKASEEFKKKSAR